MFIPTPHFEKGDWVRLTEDIQVMSGTFTKGHEFKIVGCTERGYDLRDENYLIIDECSPYKFEKIDENDEG